MKDAFTEIGDAHASTVKAEAPHPLMHRTESVDYGIVISGEMTLVLDKGETLLKAGDVVIQRGTNHAWASRSCKPCWMRSSSSMGGSSRTFQAQRLDHEICDLPISRTFDRSRSRIGLRPRRIARRIDQGGSRRRSHSRNSACSIFRLRSQILTFSIRTDLGLVLSLQDRKVPQASSARSHFDP